jgi:hypothetical protein
MSLNMMLSLRIAGANLALSPYPGAARRDRIQNMGVENGNRAFVQLRQNAENISREKGQNSLAGTIEEFSGSREKRKLRQSWCAMENLAYRNKTLKG